MEKLPHTDSILGGVQTLDCMHFDMHTASWLQELAGTVEGIRCPEKARMGNILFEALNSQVLDGVAIDRGGVPCFSDILHEHPPMPDQIEKQPSFQQLLTFPFSNRPDAYGLDHVAARHELLPEYDMNIGARFGRGRPSNLLQGEVRIFEPESCITQVNSESCSLPKTEAKDQFCTMDAPEEGVSSANQERNSSNTANSSENRNPYAPSQGIRGRRKRKRSKACKNSEEVESQRMTHIAVERNRRKQMNEHLNVLRSLMPGSFIQRGDQASIIGGAIDFVKELEQLLQSLQAQKRTRQCEEEEEEEEGSYSPAASAIPVFNGFFLSPQYTSYSSQWKAKYIMDATKSSYLDPPANELTAENKSAVADVEVTVIETHASLKILSQKRPGQLLKAIAALENLDMSILHLNITTIDHSVLYSFNVKIGEECRLSSADEIAATVHQIFSMIHTSNNQA